MSACLRSKATAPHVGHRGSLGGNNMTGTAGGGLSWVMPTVEGLMRDVADSADAAYVLSRDFKIIQVNAGFVRFAVANGGQQLGEHWRGLSVIDAISPVLR